MIVDLEPEGRTGGGLGAYEIWWEAYEIVFIFAKIVSCTHGFFFGHFLPMILLFVFCSGHSNDIYAQSSKVKQAVSGFYQVVIDISHKKGIKLYGKNEHYLLVGETPVTMAQVKQVTKEYNSNFKYWGLTFQFDEAATKSWLTFTTNNMGWKVGFVINNQLVCVATIMSPIKNGLSVLSGAYTEQEIDQFLTLYQRELRTLKTVR